MGTRSASLPREYYFIDIDLKTVKLVGWVISDTAKLTGETGDANSYRVFLTKGQYGKLKRKLGWFFRQWGSDGRCVSPTEISCGGR